MTVEYYFHFNLTHISLNEHSASYKKNFCIYHNVCTLDLACIASHFGGVSHKNLVGSYTLFNNWGTAKSWMIFLFLYCINQEAWSDLRCIYPNVLI